ncbi:MAG: hypothetical protein KatS3mg065_1102 [Chloroflexota bacterium]|nr:MAG: hypothetical protein KatS3mg065_1102 [Chloroflexota bacterium]
MAEVEVAVGEVALAPGPKPGLDRRRYFDIMGAAPTAVTIVTTLDEAERDEPDGSDDGPGRGRPGRPVGLTVSAVTSISAEPPILAVCLDVRSRTLPVVLRAGRFAVNFLRGDRAALAERFASPVADRFAGVTWRPGTLGAPILVDDALAHAECRLEGTIAVGDHVVVLGLVVAGAPPPPGSRPLMYFRHGFSAWAGPVEDRRAGEGTEAAARDREAGTTGGGLA